MAGTGQLSELFLSIDDFWDRAPELADALAGIDNEVTALATQAFYCTNDDRALIALVLDRKKTARDTVGRLAQLLFSLRIDCFELAALSTPEREHFHLVELPRYEVSVKAADSAATAVIELYRVAGGTDDRRGDWAQGTPVEVTRPRAGQYSQVRRKPQSRDAVGAKGTSAPEPPAPGTALGSSAPGTLAPGTSALGTSAPETDAPETSAPETSRARPPVQVQPPRAASHEYLIRDRADITAGLAGPGSWASTDSGFDRTAQIADGSAEGALEGGVKRARTQSVGLGLRLRVRFLRGERWLAGRVRYVSNREIRIATGAPLRLGDAAILGLSFGGEEVFVTGTVSEVEPIDSEPVSSPGFSVAFGRLEKPKSRKLVDLLKRARDAGVSLTPPPVRGAPRFPVSWPVVVRTSRGANRAVALDVSWSGVYLDVEADVGSDVLFAIPLDNAGDSIRCRGTVVRQVNQRQAETYQTTPGCGITITHFGAGDADRYRSFLDRVKSRAQRRVVVAAAPLRAQGLTRALASAGYAVTSSTDPNALAELADSEPRPPDIAVIDESLAGAMEGEMLRALFRKRNVPCLATAEEASDKTRQQVDRMLAVETS